MAGRSYKRRPTAEAPPEIRYGELFQDALTGDARMSEIYRQGYEYSLLNQQFLYQQGAREPVASYDNWLKLNRQVQKGSRGFYIIRPYQAKLKDELDEHGKPKTITRFRPVRGAFTYSQTEGEPLPEAEPRDWCWQRMFGARAISLIAFDNVSLNMQGFSYARNAAISPVAGYPEKTAVHEAAHIEAGHTGEEFDYDQHRGLAEVEAESTAFIVAHEVGLPIDVQGSRHYIQSYLKHELGDDEYEAGKFDKSIRKIFKLADLLRRSGYAAEPQEEELGATA